MTAQSIKFIHTPDYQHLKQNFLEELTLPSEGNSSTISFIKHQLPDKPLLKPGIVQGIVIGGTNYIVSTEEIKQNSTREILRHDTGILPILDTKKTFVDFLIAHLDAQADAIGINFGFPLNTHTGSEGEIDGKLLRGTKEHAFAGLKEPIGELV